MKLEITGTTVERAIAIGEKLNQQNARSVAIEMTGDKVTLSVIDSKFGDNPEPVRA